MNIINFSGGRTSAYMTKRLIDEGLTNYIVCFQNTGKEMPQTLDFINECDKRWNVNILWLEYRKPNSFEIVTYETASRDGKPFAELIEHKKGALPNVMMRFCTIELKIKTLHRYLKSIGVVDYDIYNGIRYDEPKRWSKDRRENIYLPLVGWKVKKLDVLNFWSQQDFDLQINEPFGNCDGCFLKGKGKLIQIENKLPGTLNWWADLEQRATFKKEISYKQLINNAKQDLQLFNDDPSFECFCNID
jgi:3'-phosphoadenosine 5'-phosphosulfate sulfotransferase (PAPS reductase)/FAD synthetase